MTAGWSRATRNFDDVVMLDDVHPPHAPDRVMELDAAVGSIRGILRIGRGRFLEGLLQTVFNILGGDTFVQDRILAEDVAAGAPA